MPPSAMTTSVEPAPTLTMEQMADVARLLARAIRETPPAAPRLALTISEAAKSCGVSTSIITREIHSGRLRCKRTSESGKYLISVRALEAWFEDLPDG